MRITRTPFLVCFFFTYCCCQAQELKIQTIQDFGLKPLPNTKILILNNDSEIITITNTDNNGNLDIELSYGSYTIKASHLAFEKWSQKITFNSSTTILKIRMTQRIENLEAVLINTSGYIIKRGDTTTISLPKIINGKERNVIDVLKKIKGVQVRD